MCQPGGVAGQRGPLRRALTGPPNLTTASIGVVTLTGKSRASDSATTRGPEPDGSARASVPPQVIERNGEPSASRAITMTAM